jgi:hypothetical protein
MKKLIVLLAAILFVVPLMGCSGQTADEGPVTMPDGSKPDASKEGTNEAAGGQTPMESK